MTRNRNIQDLLYFMVTTDFVNVNLKYSSKKQKDGYLQVIVSVLS